MSVTSSPALSTQFALVGDKNTRQSLRVSAIEIRLVATVASAGPETTKLISTDSAGSNKS